MPDVDRCEVRSAVASVDDEREIVTDVDRCEVRSAVLTMNVRLWPMLTGARSEVQC